MNSVDPSMQPQVRERQVRGKPSGGSFGTAGTNRSARTIPAPNPRASYDGGYGGRLHRGSSVPRTLPALHASISGVGGGSVSPAALIGGEPLLGQSLRGGRGGRGAARVAEGQTPPHSLIPLPDPQAQRERHDRYTAHRQRMRRQPKYSGGGGGNPNGAGARRPHRMDPLARGRTSPGALPLQSRSAAASIGSPVGGGPSAADELARSRALLRQQRRERGPAGVRRAQARAQQVAGGGSGMGVVEARARLQLQLQKEEPRGVASGTRGRRPARPPPLQIAVDMSSPSRTQPVDASPAGQCELEQLMDTAAAPKPKFFLNIFGASKGTPALLRTVAAQRGWGVEDADNRRGTIFWVTTPEELDARLKRKKTNQRISKIPGMGRCCNKVTLARVVADWRRRRDDPEEVDTWWPQTWVVPEQLEELLADDKNFKRPLIFKPDDGTHGNGIHIVLNPTDLENAMRKKSQFYGDECVVQRYVKSPMLLNGFKFDLRLYVLVLSSSPLRAFVCTEGLVRVCSVPYEKPNPRNSHRTAAHLTNYSLQKHESDYEHADDPTDGTRGSKRTVSSVWEYMRSQGHDIDALWDGIKQLAGSSCAAMVAATTDTVDSVPLSSLVGAVNVEQAEAIQTDCFHLLGIDVILDHKGRPVLLEVNSNPSLSVDSTHVASEQCAEPVLATAAVQAAYSTALLHMKKKGKPCKCASHHRRHLHRPCAIDLVIKTACVGDALEMVRRDSRAKKAGLPTPSPEELTEGTQYQALSC